MSHGSIEREVAQQRLVAEVMRYLHGQASETGDHVGLFARVGAEMLAREADLRDRPGSAAERAETSRLVDELVEDPVAAFSVDETERAVLRTRVLTQVVGSLGLAREGAYARSTLLAGGE